jgi:hypothetical protein
MTTPLCNPVTLWQSLSPVQQERLGILAITVELSIQIATSDAVATDYARANAAETTKDEAEGELTDFITAHFPQAYDEAGEPLRPDLNAIGIRQCTTCGCTENYACKTPSGPCSWAAPTLCTACLPPAKEA